MKKRVFYFNINYLCDNKCIFCYSHNTNNLYKNNSVSFLELIKVINKYKISNNDRIILNGGEPLLHSEINEILNYLNQTGIEILIFTNGRNIKKLNPKYLNRNIRFIIPIHGDEEIHDYITNIKDSFKETVEGLNWLYQNKIPCLTDIKIILNNRTIQDEEFKKSLKIWKKIPFNNAIHITKMAETKISKINNCIPIPIEKANEYTLKLFNEFKNERKIKLYSTCIKNIFKLNKYEIENKNLEIELLYKDYISEYYIKLEKKNIHCNLKCTEKEYCLSEVSNYKVLEFNNKFYKNME